MGTCTGCGEKKGDRDRNAGWFNLTPRGEVEKAMLFCPACSGALLVGLDAKLAEGKKNPKLRAVLIGDLDRALFALMGLGGAGEHAAVVDWLEAITKDTGGGR